MLRSSFLMSTIPPSLFDDHDYFAINHVRIYDAQDMPYKMKAEDTITWSTKKPGGSRKWEFCFEDVLHQKRIRNKFIQIIKPLEHTESY